MGKARGGGARCPWGEMAALLGLGGGARDAASRIPRTWEAEITKKLAEERRWARSRTSKKKYRMPESQRLDGMVDFRERFYRVKTGLCLSGQAFSV